MCVSVGLDGGGEAKADAPFTHTQRHVGNAFLADLQFNSSTPSSLSFFHPLRTDRNLNNNRQLCTESRNSRNDLS